MVQLGVHPPLPVLGRKRYRALGHGSHPGAHQPTAIQHNPNRLAALCLVLTGNRAAPARRGRPANVAQIVALTVLAQTLKIAAQPALSRLAQLEIDLAAAGEKDLLLLAGAQGGVNPHRLYEGRLGPALGEPQRRAVADVKPARLPIAALLWFDAVPHARRHTRKCGQPVRRRFQNQGRRQIVHQPAFDDYLALVFQGQLDFGFTIERGRIGPGTACNQIAGLGQAQTVEQRGKQDQNIPGRHGVAKALVPESRDQPHEADDKQADAARGEAESPAAAPLTCGANRAGMEGGGNHCRSPGGCSISWFNRVAAAFIRPKSLAVISRWANSLMWSLKTFSMKAEREPDVPRRLSIFNRTSVESVMEIFFFMLPQFNYRAGSLTKSVFPQGLKPTQPLVCLTYGLKPVPFKTSTTSEAPLTRISNDPPADHCLGTGTAAITSVKTRSASKPSNSASGLSITRCRSTGCTARLTSSGTR